MRVVILILATALFVLSGSPLLAQRDYPATATIRGENIWLRVDPAEDTEVLTYLQRGDPIRVTADAVPGDGDAFYPIEVVETGETGWVRDLAVDPRSFTPVETLPEVVIDEPPPEVVVDEPPPEEEPAPRERRNTTPRDANRGRTDGLSISGVGLDVSEPFTLEPGRYQASASVNVTGSFDGFAAYLHGPNGYRELLFNETLDGPQQWTGEAIVETEIAGEYFVEATNTESEWTIELAPS
jgi:hypothetical protein